jgi:hypothetical protein
MWIEVFKTGTHTDMSGNSSTFNEENLDEIVDAYNQSYQERVNDAPVVVGHPKHNHPRYGSVEKLKRVGAKIVAKVGKLNPTFATWLKNGTYNRVSSSLFKPNSPANPTKGKWNFRHLGFLGGAAPAIPGLKIQDFSESDSENFDVAFADSEGFISFVEEGVHFLTSEDEGMEHSDNNDDMALEAELQQERERNKELIKKLRNLEFSEFLSSEEVQKKVTPGIRSKVLTFAEHLDDSEPVCFAEGEQSITQLEQFKKILQDLPDQVEFGEQLPAEDNFDFAEDANALSKAAKEYQAKKKAEGITISNKEAIDFILSKGGQK